jgi:adenylate cyclase
VVAALMKASTKKAVVRRSGELRFYMLVVAIAYVSTIVLGVLLAPLRTNLQNLVFDQYQRWHPREYGLDQPVRILDIDDESIRRIGRWPWPRQKMATIVDALIKANVATISFGVLFSEKDRPNIEANCGAYTTPSGNQEESCDERADGDFIFAKAIANRPVVLGSLFTRTRNGAAAEIPVKGGFAVAGDAPVPYLNHLSGAIAPLPSLVENAAGIGFMNWLPDDDRVIRRVPLLLDVNGQPQPSLALESLRVAQDASSYVIKSTNASGETFFGGSLGVTAIRVGDIIIPTEAAADIRIYFAKSDERRSIPAWKVFSDDADLSDLAGKIVVVGVSATLISDVIATPLNSSTSGLEAHAQLIEQILSGVSLLRPDWASGAELLISAVLTLALIIAMPVVPVLWSALLGGLAVGAMALASWVAFTRHGVLLDPVTPSFSSGLVFLAGVLSLYSQKLQQANEIRSAFGRFVSPAVVARLAENPENLQLGGLQRRLTLMFCDLRSFTSLSEGLSAFELTSFLNEYLTPMTNVVLKEMGTIDKYMGDAIMAFWNAPLDDPMHGAHAVRAALEMRETLARLNLRWGQSANQSGVVSRKVKFGIGLNTGECCVGNLGSTLRFDYSAIGDEVNIASRLDGASKVFGVDIIASASTREEAPEFAWLEIDRVLLKNKTRPTAVFALVGSPSYAGSATFRDLVTRHEEMLAAYRARDFATARDVAKVAAELGPDDVKGLYAYYQTRYDELLRSDLAPEWAPMVALQEK